MLRPSSQRPQAQRHVQAQKSTRPEQSLEQVLSKSRDDAGDDNDDIDTNDLLLQEEVDEPMQRQQQRPTKVYITQEKDDRIDRRDEYHENDNIGKLGKRTESMKDSPTHSKTNSVCSDNDGTGPTNADTADSVTRNITDTEQGSQMIHDYDERHGLSSTETTTKNSEKKPSNSPTDESSSTRVQTLVSPSIGDLPPHTHDNLERQDRSKANIPPFLYNHDAHPGLEAYWYWQDVETSLFRIYAVATQASSNNGSGTSEDYTATPPFIPSSRRGTVQVHLEVTNELQDRSIIHAFWIDYKGREISKGRILPHQTWIQSTWIDHPWVFRKEQPQGQLLLYYVPYRIIPTTALSRTNLESDPSRGVHRFSIRSAPPYSRDACVVDDPILPYPARDYCPTPTLALQWAVQFAHRMNYSNWDCLFRCIGAILQHPDQPYYRSFRIANRLFGPQLWQTPARGILLAMGFYENGSHVQVGGGQSSMLSRDRVQELSLWLWKIQQWNEQLLQQQQRGEGGGGEGESEQQPLGAMDGYGRAGYGRAGTINF